MVKSRYYQKNKAFSLIEVIIAVAILSIGIVVCLQALSFSARLVGLTCDITDAVFLTEDLLDGLEFRQWKHLTTGEDRADRKERFNWSYSIAKSEAAPELYRLDFSIHWQRLAREERIDLNSYLRK